MVAGYVVGDSLFQLSSRIDVHRRVSVPESVEHGPRVREIMSSPQTNNLSNGYLSLPSNVLGTIRLGLGLGASVS